MFDMADIHLFLPPPGRPPPFYEALAKEAYNTHISNPEVSSLIVSSSSDHVYPSTINHTQRDFVFMDVCIEGELIGRLTFELYKHLCPDTCANFVALCTGERGVSGSGARLSYVNSLFHRVVKGGWIQGGGKGYIETHGPACIPNISTQCV